ncbi:hypothetical protein PUN16_030685 [Pseudomonas aeruginosa]|uniref:hypothetical protein n=1 Tax=Pseudomonas aeruginosa TaxID=287 RepID=UPI0023B0E439|nr:hypothetical protein [Pseudomonas aeruginosa]MDE8666929.1 hypothetical protein [Pseudomonas aeruginosa]
MAWLKRTHPEGVPEDQLDAIANQLRKPARLGLRVVGRQLMLKLKEVLAGVSKTQADLARAVDLSPAAIAQLINHGLWPGIPRQISPVWCSRGLSIRARRER